MEEPLVRVDAPAGNTRFPRWAPEEAKTALLDRAVDAEHDASRTAKRREMHEA